MPMQDGPGLARVRAAKAPRETLRPIGRQARDGGHSAIRPRMARGRRFSWLSLAGPGGGIDQIGREGPNDLRDVDVFEESADSASGV